MMRSLTLSAIAVCCLGAPVVNPPVQDAVTSFDGMAAHSSQHDDVIHVTPEEKTLLHQPHPAELSRISRTHLQPSSGQLMAEVSVPATMDIDPNDEFLMRPPRISMYDLQSKVDPEHLSASPDEKTLIVKPHPAELSRIPPTHLEPSRDVLAVEETVPPGAVDIDPNDEFLTRPTHETMYDLRTKVDPQHLVPSPEEKTLILTPHPADLSHIPRTHLQPSREIFAMEKSVQPGANDELIANPPRETMYDLQSRINPEHFVPTPDEKTLIIRPHPADLSHIPPAHLLPSREVLAVEESVPPQEIGSDPNDEFLTLPPHETMYDLPPHETMYDLQSKIDPAHLQPSS